MTDLVDLSEAFSLSLSPPYYSAGKGLSLLSFLPFSLALERRALRSIRIKRIHMYAGKW